MYCECLVGIFWEPYDSALFMNSPLTSSKRLLAIYIHVPYHKFLFWKISLHLFYLALYELLVPIVLKPIISYSFRSEKVLCFCRKIKCKVNLKNTASMMIAHG